MPSAWQSTEYFVAEEEKEERTGKKRTAVYRRRQKAEMTAGIPRKINIERCTLSPTDSSADGANIFANPSPHALSHPVFWKDSVNDNGDQQNYTTIRDNNFSDIFPIFVLKGRVDLPFFLFRLIGATGPE